MNLEQPRQIDQVVVVVDIVGIEIERLHEEVADGRMRIRFNFETDREATPPFADLLLDSFQQVLDLVIV